MQYSDNSLQAAINVATLSASITSVETRRVVDWTRHEEYYYQRGLPSARSAYSPMLRRTNTAVFGARSLEQVYVD